ncbi:hypothetical protein A6R68_21560 [Neotoma lepida]|uniref:Charged multivesicular body protein 3 n=1 Tax=Neotoma lepida TaxID=56216 RepID=A0A1A6HR85_NEOLE|nr:hypothetical protein A6R68_21560 [Neotoma lepida]
MYCCEHLLKKSLSRKVWQASPTVRKLNSWSPIHITVPDKSRKLEQQTLRLHSTTCKLAPTSTFMSHEFSSLRIPPPRMQNWEKMPGTQARRLPVTCLGTGSGKSERVRGVQFVMRLFGKTQEKPPKELVNEWSLKIRKEMRVVDRQIRDFQREEEKVKQSVKDTAKKGQKDVCVVLAKEMIRSRKL